MYSPEYYREEQAEKILSLVRRYNFATLLTVGGESVSHLPFALVTDSKGRNYFLSHMARANPHWQELKGAKKAKALFQGPHGYISPSWYGPQPDNVPTWNYAAVHVRGIFQIIDDKAEAARSMRLLVERFESLYGTGWRLPENEPAVEALMRGVVVFKLTELEFEAKFKLSQRQPSSDRQNVVRQLKKIGQQGLSELANLMEENISNVSIPKL